MIMPTPTTMYETGITGYIQSSAGRRRHPVLRRKTKTEATASTVKIVRLKPINVNRLGMGVALKSIAHIP
jgi:hypothetical protein